MVDLTILSPKLLAAMVDWAEAAVSALAVSTRTRAAEWVRN